MANGVQAVSRDDLDLPTDIRGQRSLHREEVHGVHAEPYVGYEVEIARRSVFTTGDGAEDRNVKKAAGAELVRSATKYG